jgi:hypothetical protein
VRPPLLITSDKLSIYLNDHLAGSTAGRDLARRAARANEGNEYGEFLSGLAAEIDADRQELADLMDRLGIGTDYPKVAAAWTIEKVGRLKLNGQLTGYSPLSRLVELEGLLAGVQGKRGLWMALREAASRDTRFEEAELERLVRRADEQLEGLRKHHANAAREALSGA